MSGAVRAVKRPVIGQGPVEVVVFVVERQRYALRVDAAERVLPMAAVSPLPGSPAVALGAINLHGTVVPVLDIRRRLGLPPHDYGLGARLLVARTSRRVLALPVDEVLGVRKVTTDAVVSPDDVLPGTAYLSGIAALPDGLLLIHDLDAFLSLEEEEQLAEALETEG